MLSTLVLGLISLRSGFWPNFHPNTVHSVFLSNSYRYAIHSSSRPYFHRNTIHTVFGLISILDTLHSGF